MNKFELRCLEISRWGLKIGLSSAFLSAVADRFGLWGSAGAEGVVWGNFSNFSEYTGILAPWASGIVLTIIAWGVTILEIFLGLLLLMNFKTREVAFVSGCLLFIFGISMIATVGLKAPLDYSVFTGAFAAFFLSATSLRKN
jgi:uncharacterized membrane protein YphA (DoxX/SURF4 family)